MWCGANGSLISEFPTVALPIAAVIGLAFLLQRRRR
ncbi:PEF-CTERM sorting domain-containing protein [Methanococcoides vulcani]|nr:PEF-CTERM sorting domain-containing protein [Methanococcoides vulcani]